MNYDDDTSIGGSNRAFQPTAWTKILSVQDGSTDTVMDVLEHLVDLYWKPVYFYIRRQRYSNEDAKDLTQHFFALFMERGSLMGVDPKKGKFRSFLLASVKHFLCDQHDRRNAQKRKPNLDFAAAHPQFYEDNNFERDWAMVVLDRAFTRLQEMAPREARIVEAQRTGKTHYGDLAEEMELTEAHVKVLAHRGRKKLRQIILDELRDTVTESGQENEELAALFRALS